MQNVSSSLFQTDDKHVVIRNELGKWLGFADLTITNIGKLIEIYKEGDGLGVWDCRWQNGGLLNQSIMERQKP